MPNEVAIELVLSSGAATAFAGMSSQSLFDCDWDGAGAGVYGAWRRLQPGPWQGAGGGDF
jgi:hypothetical protein